MNEAHWLATHRVNGALTFRVGTVGSETIVAEWVGAAHLTCDRQGRDPRLDFEPGLSAAAKKKIENASTMLLRQVRGGIAFHGSCVVIGGRALLITGRSGAGKSTLAAWLVERGGASMLSDDLSPIANEHGWVACPFESTSWLDAEASACVTGTTSEWEGKQPVIAPRIAANEAPLAGIVDLAFADAPRLMPIGGVEALAALLPQTVRFIIDEPERQRRELDALLALATNVPVMRLERPRDFNGFPAVRALIDAWMATP